VGVDRAGEGVAELAVVAFGAPGGVGDEWVAGPGVGAVDGGVVDVVAPGEQPAVGSAGRGFPFQGGGQALALGAGEGPGAPPGDGDGGVLIIGGVVVVAGDGELAGAGLVGVPGGGAGVVPAGRVAGGEGAEELLVAGDGDGVAVEPYRVC